MKIQLNKCKKRRIFALNIPKAKKPFHQISQNYPIKMDLNTLIGNKSLAIDIFFMVNLFQLTPLNNAPEIKIIKLKHMNFICIGKIDKIY